jgi:hypothetical protein
MRLNRRSVLLGLGTLSATVGGAFGSGAFSSVEATRTVNINTSGDSSALLSFEANNPSTTDSGTPEDNNNIISTETPDGSDTSVIKLEQTDLNEKATTTFSDALKVSNNGEKNVGVSVNASETTYSNSTSGLVGDALDIQDTDRGNGSIVDNSSDGDNAVDLNAGNSITLTIVVDLQNNTGAAIDDIDSIVFAARQTDHSGA